jgi:hypothetical protein
MASADDKESLRIHRLIRTGQTPETILQQRTHEDTLVQIEVKPDANRARHMLLSHLMQSDASFDDLAEFAAFSTAEDSSIHVPSVDILRQLRGKQTNLTTIRYVLGIPQPPRRIAIADLLSDSESPSSSESRACSQETTSGDSSDYIPMEPPLNVPAKPWTTLTDDDELVSHLVSIFFEWINPYLRNVEEDLFLDAMRSGDLTSEYCSPLLVNSILAYACVSYNEE